MDSDLIYKLICVWNQLSIAHNQTGAEEKEKGAVPIHHFQHLMRHWPSLTEALAIILGY